MIPELSSSSTTVRLTPLRNAPLTERLSRLIDHPAFQRLRSVRQLGPTHLVYPGAVHTRFEHSLGVYDMTVRYLRALLEGGQARDILEREDVICILLASLLHDIGHYPFAHSLEAVHVEGQDTPRHEDLAGRIIRGEQQALDRGLPSLASMIESEFDVDAEAVIRLIVRKPHEHRKPSRRLAASILSSGIDADKADYLERDSVHMGVPYGRNYDRGRFLHSLCVHPEGDRIAVTSKGRVSAEIFIFGRYTMFSEAYWHHTVRAVSSMVEHAIADFREQQPMPSDELIEFLLTHDDDRLLEEIHRRAPAQSEARALLSPLVGYRRNPYKRILTLSRVYDDKESQDAYERIYHLDRDARSQFRAYLRAALGEWLGAKIAPHELLVDTPPRDKDQLEVPDIISTVDGKPVATSLADSSKVIQGIANDFIKVVKRIRIFVHPRVREMVSEHEAPEELRSLLVKRTLSFEPEDDFQQSFF
jgi:HD superfamily phosphohydrolase